MFVRNIDGVKAFRRLNGTHAGPASSSMGGGVGGGGGESGGFGGMGGGGTGLGDTSSERGSGGFDAFSPVRGNLKVSDDFKGSGMSAGSLSGDGGLDWGGKTIKAGAQTIANLIATSATGNPLLGKLASAGIGKLVEKSLSNPDIGAFSIGGLNFGADGSVNLGTAPDGSNINMGAGTVNFGDGAGGDGVSDVFDLGAALGFGSGVGGATNAQTGAASAAIDEQRRQFDLTQEQMAPFREAGVTALDQQQALLGLLGPERASEAMAQFQESPGQKFLRERQERALLRNQAAIGGLGGGNVRSALQEQAAGIAATQLGQHQNQLAALSGSGQTATGSIGQFGAGAAANIGNLMQSAGQARASGLLQQQAIDAAKSNQRAQLLGQVAQPFVQPIIGAAGDAVSDFIGGLF